MGLWSWFKSLTVVHLLLVYIFMASGFLVSILLLVGMVVRSFNKSLYRKCAFFLSYAFWCHFTFLANWWSQVECTLYMSPDVHKRVGKHHSVCLVNHTYEIDWLIAWVIAERHGMLGNTKLYAKDILKYIPVLGWTWYFTESIFLKRNWDKDKIILEKSITELVTYPHPYWVHHGQRGVHVVVTTYPYSLREIATSVDCSAIYCAGNESGSKSHAHFLILFPEGTRWTPEKHVISQKIAREKGYPEYKHMLLPRTKGFHLSMQLLKGKIPELLDCTVGFPANEPEPTLLDVLSGRKIRGAIIVRPHKIDDIPCETEEECGRWLRNLYKQKDEEMEYYKQTGEFKGVPVMEVPKRYYDLCWFIFWALLTCIPLCYYIKYLLFAASFVHKVTACVTVTALFLLMKWMISFTEIKHGTSYGLQMKQNDAKKSH